MSKSIISFAPHKTALTISVLFAISSLVFVIPAMIMFSFIPNTDANGNAIQMGPPMIMFVLMPIFYLIFGYISTLIGAWLYNKVAKFTGGIKVTVVDS